MASLQYIQSATLQSVTLGSNYTAGDGSMTLTAGQGAYLPSSGDFWIAYNDGAGTIRIFKVTARSTDTLTVTAVSGEGSGDGNISSGETLRWALTVDALDQLKADIVSSVPSSGLVLLETQTASSSASLDFTSTISSTYSTYQFIVEGILPVTNNVSLYVRVSTDGGSTWAAGTSYYWTRYLVSGAPGASSADNTAQYIPMASQTNTTGAYPISGSMMLFYADDTNNYKQMTAQMAGNVGMLISMGTFKSTTAINAVQFLFSSGNIASGRIRSYGISK